MAAAMPQPRSETELVKQILVELSNRGVLAWRHNTGAGVNPAGQHVRFGLPGSADIVGVLPPDGTFLAVEAKSPKGRVREQQRKFGAAVNKRGGIWIVARSVEDVLEALQLDGTADGV